jgi:hypothetical protein
LIRIEEDEGAHRNAEDALEKVNRAITRLSLYRRNDRKDPVDDRIDAEHQYQRSPKDIWAGPGEDSNADREEPA